MAKVIIVYSTTTGNTSYAVENVKGGLEEDGLSVDVKTAEEANMEMLKNYDLIVLACPTYDEGKLQENFIPFYENLKTANLSEKLSAAISLSMKQYEQFCGSAIFLKEALEASKTKLLLEPYMFDGSPYGEEVTFKGWGKEIATKFKEMSQNI